MNTRSQSTSGCAFFVEGKGQCRLREGHAGAHEPYDSFSLTHVEDRRCQHRNEQHGGDQTSLFDCASCGVLDSRLARLQRAQREATHATKQ